MNLTNSTSASKLTPIPLRSRAGMLARARAHKKKLQNNNFMGRCYTWASSNCSSTINKVSNYLPSLTLNKVASVIVAASYFGGAAYALKNNTTSLTSQEDIFEGTALAIGTSLVTCCGTAAIHQRRGNCNEARVWKQSALISALPAALLLILQMSKTTALKADIHSSDIAYKNWAGECQTLELPSNRFNSLECSLLEGAKSYIDQNNVKNLLRSNAGAGGVYFPPDVSVVIKQDHPQVYKNVLKIEDAKKVCQDNNYQYLTIPKASFYKGFSIHSLLPIQKFNILKEMELYFENKNLFTNAIKEFTGLLCQARLNDLIGIDKLYGQSFWPRLDNVRVYLEKEAKEPIGKIALVDLDQFNLASKNDDLSHQVKTVIRFFPYHFEEILKEAKKFYPNIEDHRSALEAIKNEAINSYQNVYGKHSTFIKAKGISFSNPGEMIPISQEAKNHVKISVLEELKNKIYNYELINDKYFYFFIHLKDQKEKSFDVIEKFLPEIIDLSVAFIDAKLKEKFSSNKAIVSSLSELLSLRTLSFSIADKIFSELEIRIRPHLAELPEDSRIGIGEYLAITTFKKLQEVEYIAHAIDAHKVILFC